MRRRIAFIQSVPKRLPLKQGAAHLILVPVRRECLPCVALPAEYQVIGQRVITGKVPVGAIAN